MSNPSGWDEAVDQFWSIVNDLLTKKYHYSPRDAQQGIKAYRQEADSRPFGDVVYNKGEERTAAAIDALVREGFLSIRAS